MSELWVKVGVNVSILSYNPGTSTSFPSYNSYILDDLRYPTLGSNGLELTWDLRDTNMSGWNDGSSGTSQYSYHDYYVADTAFISADFSTTDLETALGEPRIGAYQTITLTPPFSEPQSYSVPDYVWFYLDDVAAVAVTSGDTVAEGDPGEGPNTAEFTIEIESPQSSAVTVNYTTFDDSAVAGEDFFFASSSAIIPAGETSVTVPITIIGDDIVEPDQQFSLTLTSVVSEDGTPVEIDESAQREFVTITDDDSTELSVSAANASDVAEGDLGEAMVLQFELTLDQPMEGPVTVSYTLSGTAIAGIDFVPPPSTATFEPGQTSVFVEVPIIGDVVTEFDETVTLTVTSVGGATDVVIAEGSATAVISNDDEVQANLYIGAIGASTATTTEGDPDAYGPGFTLVGTLANPADQAIYLAITPIGQGATLGEDFDDVGGLIEIPAGSLFGTLNFPVTGDLESEDHEGISFILTDIATPYPLTPINNGFGPVGLILDDDTPQVSGLAVALGTTGDDSLAANDVDEVFVLQGGSDIVSGTSQSLDGDAVMGFGVGDMLIFQNANFGPADVNITYGSALLDIDTDQNGEADTSIYLTGDFEGLDFQVTAAGADTQITVSSLAGNTAPVAQDDFGQTSGSVLALDLLANDTDVDGDVLTVAAIDNTATDGTVTDNGDGTITYAPGPAFDMLTPGDTATDSFSYTVSDGNGGTDTAAVTIDLIGAEDVTTSQPFMTLDPNANAADLTALTSLLGNDPNLTIISVTVNGGSSTAAGLATYDGSIAGLGIDAGLFLSTGDETPPLENTSEDYTLQSGRGGDSDLDAVAQSAFSGAGQSYDATVIEIEFTVTAGVEGVRLDLLFGSEEFPEYSNTSLIDVAGVFLNGENVALFNDAADQPLSVIDRNIDEDNFRDNADGSLGLVYDGISIPLSVQGAVQPGVNTLKIGIADTGDSSYDSGLFVANLQTAAQAGSGLFVTVDGDAGDNVLDGTVADEIFDAGAGADTITGGGGDDIVEAGDGDDLIILDAPCEGAVQVDGGDGDDTVSYDAAFADVTLGTTADGAVTVCNDTLIGVEVITFSDQQIDTASFFDTEQPGSFSVSDTSINEGAATLAFTVTLTGAVGGVRTVDYAFTAGSAEAGIDFTTGSGTLTFGEGETEQTVLVEILDDTLVEGAETLTLTLSNPGGDQIATITTAEATGTILDDDVVQGDKTPIVGTDDEDALIGSSGADVITGDAGDDYLTGEAGDDCLFGGADDDGLFGRAGADELLGEAGDDKLWGGAGNDTLSGGDGSDAINGGDGDDLLSGGAGTDSFATSMGLDTINDFDLSEDILILSGNTVGDPAAFDALAFLQTNGSVDGSDLHIDLGEGQGVLLTGIVDGDDPDPLASLANSVLPAEAPFFDGTTAGEKIAGGPEANLLLGGAGEDTLLGEANWDTLDGGAGDDYISGGWGNDSLQGGDGDDGLLGDTGDDTLDGGSGHNLLTGGSGADVFVNGPDGEDTVTDFAIGEDRLELSDLLPQGEGRDEAILDLLMGSATVEGGDLFFDLGDGRSIRLIDVAEEFDPEEDDIESFSTVLV